MLLKMATRPVRIRPHISRAKRLRIAKIVPNGTAYGYVRTLSRGTLKNGPSVDQQRTQISEWAASRNLNLIEIIAETSTIERVVAQDSKLLALVDNLKPGETIVALSPGHISVSFKDFATINMLLVDKGSFLNFVCDNMDMRMPSSKFSAHMEILNLELAYDAPVDSDDDFEGSDDLESYIRLTHLEGIPIKRR